MDKGEKYLIKRTLKGDKTAANDLVKIYYNEIYAFVYRQTASKETSMDITQEIFISALQTLHTYNGGKSGFRTWLYAVASNKIYDFYRSEKRRRVFTVEEIYEAELISDDDIEEMYENRELAGSALKILSGEEKTNQQIVILKIFACLKFREIGETLNLNENTVRTKYYLSLKKLREELTK